MLARRVCVAPEEEAEEDEEEEEEEDEDVVGRCLRVAGFVVEGRWWGMVLPRVEGYRLSSCCCKCVQIFSEQRTFPRSNGWKNFYFLTRHPCMFEVSNPRGAWGKKILLPKKNARANCSLVLYILRSCLIFLF